jgi:hypothetical protein
VKEDFHSVTRFLPDTTGNWSIDFHVLHAATYLLLCHSAATTSEDNDIATVTIDSVTSPPDSTGLRFLLAVNNSNFTTDAITATGTVEFPDNPVTCYLTKIDCGSGAGGKATTLPGNTTGTNWSVSFPGGFRTGECYSLEAAAGYEGTVSVAGTVS